MAASDHLQGEQLRMFMRPSEIQDLVEDSVDVGYYQQFNPKIKNVDDVWKQKEQEMVNDYHVHLERDVEKKGVEKPIVIIPPSSSNYNTNYKTYTMGQGHHRVVAAKKAEQKTGQEQYLPVVYHKEMKYIPNAVNAREYFRKKGMI